MKDVAEHARVSVICMNDLMANDESGAIGELPATVQVRDSVCPPLVVA